MSEILQISERIRYKLNKIHSNKLFVIISHPKPPSSIFVASTMAQGLDQRLLWVQSIKLKT